MLVDRVVEPLQRGVEVAGRVVQVDQGFAQPLQDGVDLLHRDVGVERGLRELADPLRSGAGAGLATLVCHDGHYDHTVGTVGADWSSESDVTDVRRGHAVPPMQS